MPKPAPAPALANATGPPSVTPASTTSGPLANRRLSWLLPAATPRGASGVSHTRRGSRCELAVSGRCARDQSAFGAELPALGAVALQPCRERPVVELVAVARHAAELAEGEALAQLQAALR